ncbi:IQ domain-containing protein K [Lamellibrachia satsuma]|nr:IQ domain-containing protein K [Lamellibrachia satsuma]
MCSPTEYLEHYIFPFLLLALEEMLKEAKKEKCFERKRTKFNSLDFLTVYLYKYNPLHKGERDVQELEDIPFVKEWWERHPRHALPKSLLWTEEEAIEIIQNYWRGYKVRREPDVQELRVWQREWRQETENIQKKVDSFWRRNMPDVRSTNETGLLAGIESTGSIDDSLETNGVVTDVDTVPDFCQSQM